MSKIPVGKVSPVPKGNWTSDVDYQKLNMVNYNGALYIAKNDITNTTTAPSNNSGNNGEWMQATNSWGEVQVTIDNSLENAAIGDISTPGGNINQLNLRMPGYVYGTEIIDDTAGDSDTDVVWSADKTWKTKNALENIVIYKDSLENGAFEGTSGKVNSVYRIRLINLIQVKKGTTIIFSDGSLYHMVWELSSSSTSGGNVIISKSWNNDKKYIVQNDCYLMMSFAKTQGGETTTITVSDFLPSYYVLIERTNESAIVFDILQNISKSQKYIARNNIDAPYSRDLYDIILQNLIDTTKLESGYYKRSEPSTIISSTSTKHLPPIRIFSGVHYTFKNIYAYFTTIICDDGTIINLANSASPATQNINITPEKDGFVYITVNNNFYDKVMLVAGSYYYDSVYFNGYEGICKIFSNIIGPNNYATYLPDWKNAEKNSSYSIVSTTNMLYKNGGLWTDVPLELYKGQRIVTLQTIGKRDGSTQICTIANTGDVYTRYLNLGTWTAWRNSSNKVYTCEKSGGDFSNLVEAINTVVDMGMDKTLYVGAGDWDLIDDFTEYYGPTCFDESDETVRPVDIPLKNRIHIIFSQNAFVHYEFNPTTEYYGNTFTPFRAGPYGFTLEGLKLSVTGARYCIHEERNSATDQYNNHYINCEMYLDNRNNSFGYIQCIGGGLGTNGNIIVENCIFDSELRNTTNLYIVSWHNTAAANASSKIVIKDCYFVRGGIRFSWYGTSTNISTMIITNCSYLASPQHRAETENSTVENTRIIAWNNELRTV